ncbi:MAG: DUF6944 family repetitive protein [Bacillus sp. (in: firmicutes)]
MDDRQNPSSKTPDDQQQPESETDQNKAEVARRNEISTATTWWEAIGTIISALGTTPTFSTQLQNDLGIWGNVIQATATGVQADVSLAFNLNSLSNIVDAVGLTEEAAASIYPFQNQNLQTIIILQGNEIQALSSNIAIVYALTQKMTVAQAYNLYGNIIQLIGLYVEIASNILTLRDGNTNTINALNIAGNWIQAIGSVLVAIGQSLATKPDVQDDADDYSDSQPSDYATGHNRISPYY